MASDGESNGIPPGLAELAMPVEQGDISFDALPLELRLKCLANCDWQTLSRVACVSRSTKALVSSHHGRRHVGPAASAAAAWSGGSLGDGCSPCPALNLPGKS